MKIDPAEWHAFVVRAEDQDCEQLDDICSHRKYVMTGDKHGQKPVTLAGCGNSVLFVVPYVSTLAHHSNESVTVCAVDDNVAMWPRFGGDAYAKYASAKGQTINEIDGFDWGDQLT